MAYNYYHAGSPPPAAGDEYAEHLADSQQRFSNSSDPFASPAMPQSYSALPLETDPEMVDLSSRHHPRSGSFSDGAASAYWMPGEGPQARNTAGGSPEEFNYDDGGRGRKRRLLLIGGIFLGLIAILAIGLGVGLGVGLNDTKKNNQDAAARLSGNGGSSGSSRASISVGTLVYTSTSFGSDGLLDHPAIQLVFLLPNDVIRFLLLHLFDVELHPSSKQQQQQQLHKFLLVPSFFNFERLELYRSVGVLVVHILFRRRYVFCLTLHLPLLVLTLAPARVFHPQCSFLFLHSILFPSPPNLFLLSFILHVFSSQLNAPNLFFHLFRRHKLFLGRHFRPGNYHRGVRSEYNAAYLYGLERWVLYLHDKANLKCTLPNGQPLAAPPAADGRKIVWFDIDNCLYSKQAGIAELMKDKIRTYFTRLGLPDAEAARLHHHYYTEYGLAIRGLVRHHKVDPLDYDKHCDAALPLETVLRPDQRLQELLRDVDREKVRVWALTNAYVNHAVRVLKLLGLSEYFEGVVSCDYGASEFSCKPEAEFFAQALSAVSTPPPAPSSLYFVDDSALNIKGAHSLGWGHCVLFDEFGDEAGKLGALDKVAVAPDGEERPRVSVVNSMHDLRTVWKDIFASPSPQANGTA
ncbi:hypothetical protein JCM21900_004594 [Sporobolomyces salmonicolor]